jgi:hypothetical protein
MRSDLFEGLGFAIVLGLILAALMALGGCAGQGPLTVTKYQHFSTPPELRACKAEPSLRSFKNDNQFAGYVLDLRDAGADCRDKLSRRNQVEDAVR